MDNLIARIRRMGLLILAGVCLIIYAGLGFVYLQQGPKQRDLEEQINKTSIVVSRPLPSIAKLQAEYDEVNSFLSPLTVPAALEIIVGIARENGIDVALDAGKFHIPSPASPVAMNIGEGTYLVLSLKNIRVQGDPDAVMAFISDLDSGKTLKTMVLKKLNISQTELEVKTEEQARREGFRLVSLAVRQMMADNQLSSLPKPVTVATDNMSAFPDNTTVAADKGYTGLGTPRDGYVLYEHDRISVDDTAQFETVSYIPILTTKYYYTSEADGTVRQFDGPDVTTATEYPNNEWEARRTEMYLVSLAVMAMMADNGLSAIPAPLDYAGGMATNDMGSTLTTGFPDNISVAADKGYTGLGTPRDGYVLYEHARISVDDTAQFETVSYIPILTTKYYYTSEADGTVRQFDGPDVTTATEYPNIEIVAVLVIDIYTKPLAGD